MTDSDATPKTDNAQEPTQRVFKIGTTRIVEDDTMRGKSIEDVRAALKMSYPEIASATVKEYTEGGVHLVEFVPVAGRKG